MRDERHADHLLRQLSGFVGILRQLDAAAFAAAAGVDLRFDDDASAQLFGSGTRGVSIVGNDAARRRYTVTTQDFFRLILVDFHRARTFITLNGGARTRPKVALNCRAWWFVMPIDDARFRLAMSHFASGVTVVTTEHEGRPFGMTVASFASLSLHPPLVLVCIETSAKTHEAIIAAGKFGVSILGADQSEISSKFASRGDDRFTGVDIVRGALDVPLIAGALTTIECRLHAQLPGGDHTIFVGEVVDVKTREGDPLLYFRSGYREMQN